MENLNLDDDFVPFWGFFPKWNGRKYFFRNGNKTSYYRPWKKHANPGLNKLSFIL